MLHGYPMARQYTNVGFKLSVTLFTSVSWNAYMRATNGNSKNCLNVAHWNGGSSHLGKSSKGKEKLEHVKYLVNKHNIDILGILESNLHRSIDKIEVKIDKYRMLCQEINMSRIIVYVRDNLDCKLVEDMMDPGLSCIWLEIGRGRSKWLIGQLYREHRLLGDRESATSEKQKERWNNILDRVRMMERYENDTIMGDLNINIDPNNMDSNQLN